MIIIHNKQTRWECWIVVSSKRYSSGKGHLAVAGSLKPQATRRLFDIAGELQSRHKENQYRQKAEEICRSSSRWNETASSLHSINRPTAEWKQCLGLPIYQSKAPPFAPRQSLNTRTTTSRTTKLGKPKTENRKPVTSIKRSCCSAP
jgi:hypothetical protein